jgi:serine/threonine-protein kinase
VYLDDEPIGETDRTSGRLVKSGVAPGEHRLRLTRPGHDESVHTVQVAPSGPTTVRATLAATPAAAGVPVWVLAAAAGALVLVGVLMTLWLRSRREEVPATRVMQTARVPPTRMSATARAPATRVSSTGTGRGTPAELLAELGTQVLEAATSGGASEKPERFGDYMLLERLGKGGMASVYKAEKNGEICALKRPLQGFLEDPEFLKRFLREAEIGHTLHHPNIIRIFEQGAVGSCPYFTMELVRGETLQAHVRRSGALTPRASTQIVAQVAEALDYAHLKGVVHRDLKPSNIMIGEDGTVKVMDYGIARARRFDGLTMTGSFLGTPDYVAPETAEGKGADARSDLYSLGIVYYEILTGQKPFVADTPFATLRKHVAEPPTPPTAISPDTPRELEAIILRLLRKDPADRYPGAEELLLELRAFLNRAA